VTKGRITKMNLITKNKMKLIPREIVIPVFFSIDEKSDNIIDEDEIRKEFEYQLKQIIKNDD